MANDSSAASGYAKSGAKVVLFCDTDKCFVFFLRYLPVSLAVSGENRTFVH